MRELNDIENLDSLLSSMKGVSEEQKNKITQSVEIKAVKKAKDEVLPNIYANIVLLLFCAINTVVIGIIIAGFLVDSGVFGKPISPDRFITSNVLMALITGVTIQVSYAIRTITNFFFKAQENLGSLDIPTATPKSP